MSALALLNIYGGRFDGKSGVTASSVFSLRDTETGINHFYEVNKEWSAHFTKPTAIPVGFPGKPPLAKAAA